MINLEGCGPNSSLKKTVESILFSEYSEELSNSNLLFDNKTKVEIYPELQDIDFFFSSVSLFSVYKILKLLDTKNQNEIRSIIQEVLNGIFINPLVHKKQIYENLEKLTLFVMKSLIQFGELFDQYIDIIDRFSLSDSIDLCHYFCSQHKIIHFLFTKLNSSGLTVGRARYLGLVNAFYKKLQDGPNYGISVLAKLYTQCFDVIPITFQGSKYKSLSLLFCNRGLRDAPGKHFNYSVSRFSEHDTPANDDELHSIKFNIKKQTSFESDSSSGSLKNVNQLGGKRRKTDVNRSAFDSNSRNVSTSLEKFDSSKNSLYTIYKAFVMNAQFLQDPYPILIEVTTGEAIKIFASLLKIVRYLSDLQTTHVEPIINDISFLPPIDCPKMKNNIIQLLYPEEFNNIDSHDCIESRLNSISADSSLQLSLQKSLLLYNAYISFATFKELVKSESFQKEILLQIAIMLHGLFVKRQYFSSSDTSASIYENLPQSLKNVIDLLMETLNSVLDELPSCKNRIPLVNIKDTFWFEYPSHWNPPILFNDILKACNSLELVLTNWKIQGCSQYNVNSISSSEESQQNDTQTNTESNIETNSSVINQLISNGSIFFQNKSYVQSTSKQRYNNYGKNLLQLIKNQSNSNGQYPIQPIDYLKAPSFERENVSWCLSESETSTIYNPNSIQNKLFNKWHWYTNKILSDDDPVNEIEENEKSINNVLFQWRCHRLLNLTHLEIYDYSLQDRDLRMKIREDSLLDLVKATISKETNLSKETTFLKEIIPLEGSNLSEDTNKIIVPVTVNILQSHIYFSILKHPIRTFHRYVFKPIIHDFSQYFLINNRIYFSANSIKLNGGFKIFRNSNHFPNYLANYSTHFKNYYTILGVSKTATQDEIKKAYRSLAMKWHPDRNQGSKKKEAEFRFREITEAYQTLISKEKRLEYDASQNDISSNSFNKQGHQTIDEDTIITDQEAYRIFDLVFKEFFQPFSINQFHKPTPSFHSKTQNLNSQDDTFINESFTFFYRNGRKIERKKTTHIKGNQIFETITEKELDPDHFGFYKGNMQGNNDINQSISNTISNKIIDLEDLLDDLLKFNYLNQNTNQVHNNAHIKTSNISNKAILNQIKYKLLNNLKLFFFNQIPNFLKNKFVIRVLQRLVNSFDKMKQTFIFFILKNT